jgi:hypothetical protein
MSVGFVIVGDEVEDSKQHHGDRPGSPPCTSSTD